MSSKTKATILVVDDEGPILSALTIRLEHEGYTVLSARDGLSACTKARDNLPDIALLDINLPNETGFDVAEKLDRLTSKTIHKVFITASKKEGLRKRARLAGASAFIEKPFTADTLFDSLVAILERSRVA